MSFGAGFRREPELRMQCNYLNPGRKMFAPKFGSKWQPLIPIASMPGWGSFLPRSHSDSGHTWACGELCNVKGPGCLLVCLFNHMKSDLRFFKSQVRIWDLSLCFSLAAFVPGWQPPPLALKLLSSLPPPSLVLGVKDLGGLPVTQAFRGSREGSYTDTTRLGVFTAKPQSPIPLQHWRMNSDQGFL